MNEIARVELSREIALVASANDRGAIFFNIQVTKPNVQVASSTIGTADAQLLLAMMQTRHR